MTTRRESLMVLGSLVAGVVGGLVAGELVSGKGANGTNGMNGAMGAAGQAGANGAKARPVRPAKQEPRALMARTVNQVVEEKLGPRAWAVLAQPDLRVQPDQLVR